MCCQLNSGGVIGMVVSSVCCQLNSGGVIGMVVVSSVLSAEQWWCYRYDRV